MFSLNKILWLIVILFAVWYIFKFFEKKNSKLKKSPKNERRDKNIEAFKCSICGLWSTGDSCNNQKCSSKQ